MTRFFAPLSVAVVLLSLPLPASAVDLKPKFKPGADVYYTLAMKLDFSQKIESAPDQPPQEVKMTRDSTAGMRLKCNEVKEDGAAILEWTLLYIAMSGAGAMPMQYDSRDPALANSPLGSMLAPLLNNPATITVDALGKVVDYKDPAALGGGPIRQFMDMLFSKDAFEEFGLFVTRGAPTGAEPGANWSETTPVEMSEGLGTLLVTSNYKLAEVKADGKAEITLQGTMAMKKPEPAAESPAPAPGMVVDKGEFSAKNLWDCSAGQLLSCESQRTFQGSATGPFGKVKIEEKSVSTMKRTTPEEIQQALQKPASTQPAAQPQPAPEKKTGTGESPSPEGGNKP